MGNSEWLFGVEGIDDGGLGDGHAIRIDTRDCARDCSVNGDDIAFVNAREGNASGDVYGVVCAINQALQILITHNIEDGDLHFDIIADVLISIRFQFTRINGLIGCHRCGLTG